MGRPGGTDTSSVRLKEEVESERMSDGGIDDGASGKIARAVEVAVFAEEAGVMTLCADADEDFGTVALLDTLARADDRAVFVIEGCGVLTLRDAVSKDEDTVRQLAVVLLAEDLQVGLHHTGELLDDFLTTLLKTDLSRVHVAVGAVCGNRARDGGRIGVASFDRGLSVSSTSRRKYARQLTCPRSAPSSIVLPLIMPGNSEMGTWCVTPPSLLCPSAFGLTSISKA